MEATGIYQTTQGVELPLGDGEAQMIGCEFPIVSVWSFVNFPKSPCLLYRRFHATTRIGRYVYVFGGETKTRPTAAGAHSVKTMLGDLLCYDITNDMWEVLDAGGRDSPMPRKGAVLEAYNSESLLLFGGAATGSTFNDLWEFKLARRTWINLTVPILEQLLSPSGAVGLQDSGNANALLSNLQKKKNSPNEIAQTIASKYPNCYPAPRAYFVACVHRDRLIVYGGYGFKNESSTLWIYDLPEGEWQGIPLAGRNRAPEPWAGHSHPGVRFGLVACCYGDNMFIFGGQQQSKLVGSVLWRLDLGSFTWQQVGTTGSAPAQRTYATGCLIGNRWFIHGGSSADDVFADSHELNLDMFHWHPSNTLLTSVTVEGHTSACVFSDWGMATILLIGGATSGPAIPEGPVMQTNFLLHDISVLTNSENSRLEDLVVRPVGASQLLWHYARQVLAGRIEEARQLETERQKNKELISSHEDLRMQYDELHERFALLEKQTRQLLNPDSQRKGDSTSHSNVNESTTETQRVKDILIRTSETVHTRFAAHVTKLETLRISSRTVESSQIKVVLDEFRTLTRDVDRNLAFAISTLNPSEPVDSSGYHPKSPESAANTARKSKPGWREHADAPRPERLESRSPAMEKPQDHADIPAEQVKPVESVSVGKENVLAQSRTTEKHQVTTATKIEKKTGAVRVEVACQNTEIAECVSYDQKITTDSKEEAISPKMVDTASKTILAKSKGPSTKITAGTDVGLQVAEDETSGANYRAAAEIEGTTRGVTSYTNPAKGKLDLKPRQTDRKRSDAPGSTAPKSYLEDKPTSPAASPSADRLLTAVLQPGINRTVQVGAGTLKLQQKTVSTVGNVPGSGAATAAPVLGCTVGVGAGDNSKI